MYKWFQLAKVCYVYLPEVLDSGEDHHAETSNFRRSRWFERGWTLQELIAPAHVEFLSRDWVHIGSKRTLIDLVESITGIDQGALLHLKPLDAFSIAQRFSWAADRKTTREEDRAYSLLGIFNINMPTIFGEGENAFKRLQEQIMQRIPDQSLFAWGEVYSPGSTDKSETLHLEARAYDDNDNLSPLFLPSPDCFMNCEAIKIPHHDNTQLPFSQPHDREIEYIFTPHGIRTQFRMIHLTEELIMDASKAEDIRLKFEPGQEYDWYIAIFECEHVNHPGHLLGRVCYVPSSDSAVEFVHPGRISIRSEQGEELSIYDLFPLSPQTIMRCRQHTKLKTVYIPQPRRRTPENSRLLY